MKKTDAIYEKAFLDVQRRVLMTLRGALLVSRNAAHAEEAQVGVVGEPHEPEDDAQRLASIELSEELERRDQERLARVDRALQKLDEGTYGFSDVSGEVIPKERLEQIPEAVATLEEERDREAKGG